MSYSHKEKRIISVEQNDTDWGDLADDTKRALIEQLVTLAPNGFTYNQLDSAIIPALDALDECDPDDFIADLHNATNADDLRRACSWASTRMIQTVITALQEKKQ